MKIQQMNPNFRCPTRGTEMAGAFDIYMPESGKLLPYIPQKVKLGFATEIPAGHVALLLPRSGVGSRGLGLVNTCGVIDADYRGEWMATLRSTMSGIEWERGDRLLQFLIVPVFTPELGVVDSLNETNRGAGGFGSSGI